jgi:hypothetical protein
VICEKIGTTLLPLTFWRIQPRNIVHTQAIAWQHREMTSGDVYILFEEHPVPSFAKNWARPPRKELLTILQWSTSDLTQSSGTMNVFSILSFLFIALQMAAAQNLLPIAANLGLWTRYAVGSAVTRFRIRATANVTTFPTASKWSTSSSIPKKS